jgi:hypothetical protein
MNPMTRFARAGAVAAIAATALFAPATAAAASSAAASSAGAGAAVSDARAANATAANAALTDALRAEDATAAASTCSVTGGEMSWGVRESFRSYISSSIANGSWETSDGATYETPLFSWANPTGEIDATTGEGIVSFQGTIKFSGHEGALNLVLTNPTMHFNGDGTANLMIDTSSQRPTGEIAIDEDQAYVGKIENLGPLDPASGEIAVTEAPAVLTADGAVAFGDFYASGEALDPISFTLQFGPCPGSADAGAIDDGSAETEPEMTTQNDVSDESGEQSIPWLPIILGAVALAIIAVTAGMLIAGRKKTAPQAAAPASAGNEVDPS